MRHSHVSTPLALSALFVLLLSTSSAQPAAPANLIANGDFEGESDSAGRPAHWTVSGGKSVAQQLTLDTGAGGGKSARLSCSSYRHESSDSHAMLCQAGKIAVRKGKWYELSFSIRTRGIPDQIISVSLKDTRTWQGVGLNEGVAVKEIWQSRSILFQAENDLPPEHSRLQFWFSNTGTLWLDEVKLVEAKVQLQRHPALTSGNRPNCLPNSSFECGTAGWGGYAPGVKTWAGNLFRLHGELDPGESVHGKQSLKISLQKDSLPTIFFDYFDLVEEPQPCVLAANRGWFALERGRDYCLSTFLKADRPGLGGVLLVKQAGGRTLRQNVSPTTDWQRHEFIFKAESDQAWAAAGLDLAASQQAAGSVWIDAVQLEPGDKATPYLPRSSLEIALATGETGNLFDQPDKTAKINITAANDGPAPAEVRGKIVAADFQDRSLSPIPVSFPVPAKATETKSVEFSPGAKGFFRAIWRTDAEPSDRPPQLEDLDPLHALRIALLDPCPGKDSRFGMNHAFPHAFLLNLAHRSGILWWRDWSVKWHTVQPAAGAPFDFSGTDAQIDRVLDAGGKVLLMFPFPSADWCSSAPADAVAKEEGDYHKRRLRVACAPEEPGAFSRFIEAGVRHYRDRVSHYQIFNEALYTSYSLPQKLGYTMEDYAEYVRRAAESIRANRPDAFVLAGPGLWPGRSFAEQFAASEGLRHIDAMDVHLYDRAAPEALMKPLGELWDGIRKRKPQARGIWLTELGCYADDDPAVMPLSVGDSAMTRARHESERDASEWLVKFSTLFFASGGEKVFLHAGTCPEINASDAGNVFFEYGGAPRKMLAAVSALSRRLPPESRFLERRELSPEVIAFRFRSGKDIITVAWARSGDSNLTLPPGTRAEDIMGNPIPGSGITIGETPVYLIEEGN